MKISFILVVPILIIISIYGLKYKPSKIINYGNKDYQFNTYSDVGSGGNSFLQTKIQDDDTIELKYTLNNKYEYPYIGLAFGPSDYSFMDLSEYETISLEVKSEKSDFISVSFTLFLDGFSKKGEFNSYLPVAYYLELDNENNIYRISLKDFKPHTWWISSNKVSEDIIKNFSFKSVYSIEIGNDSFFPIGVEDTILFSGLTFITNLKQVIFLILLVLVGYYLIYFTIMNNIKKNRIIKENREKIVLVPYQGLNKQITDSHEDIIDSYIFANYCDPLLNIAKVEDETNISERNIAKILKKKYNYSFPGFINYLRITEAKRLLDNTDKKIVDIAMLVGYNSLGHFNRTFKKIEDFTPTEYKKCKK